MKDATRTVWAKSWPRGGAALEGWLWDHWLPSPGQIATLAGGDDGGRALLTFLAGVHDVGKATPAFALQVGALRGEMVQTGLPMPQQLPERAARPHGLAGQVILETWLEERHGWRRPPARALASVVGGHHGIPPSSSECQDARSPREFNGLTTNGELLGTGPWIDVQYEFLDRMAARTGDDRVAVAVADGLVVVFPAQAGMIQRRLPASGTPSPGSAHSRRRTVNQPSDLWTYIRVATR